MVKQKRRISAGEFVADIRSGLDDNALMEKHQLTEEALNHLLKKLVESGAIKQSELDHRGMDRSEGSDEVRVCPACGKRFVGEADECPKCGIVISKYEARKKAEEEAAQRKRKPGRLKKIGIAAAVVIFLAVGVVAALFVKDRLGGDGATQTRKTTVVKAGDLDIKLIEAAKAGNLPVVESLIKEGANVNAQDIGGFTALTAAVREGHLKVAELLLEKGADPEIRGNYYWGETALMMAAQKSRPDLVELLLKRGALVDAKSKHTGSTPLIMASREGDPETVRKLIERGADVNARAKDGSTALIRAARRAHWAVCKQLLDKGADINAASDDGTALAWACGGGDYRKGQMEVVKLLLERGADPNGAGKDGCTALMRSARHRNPKVAQVLLAKGVNVNAQTRKGETALIIACDKGNRDFVELLLANGADVNIRDNKGWTALKHAEAKKRRAVMDLLQQHGIGR